MPDVLTVNSTVQCSHGGAISVTGASKLRAAGGAVLLKSGVNGKSVSSACSTQNTNNTSKCSTATVTGGESTKLKVNGSGVLTMALTGTTDGVPPGTISRTALQSKLKAG